MPAEMLIDAMEGILNESKRREFLTTFDGAFVLASEDDVAKLKAFLQEHAGTNVKNLAAQRVGNKRCE